MTSKRSLIGVAALFALAATGACGSDDSGGGTPTPGAGAPAAGGPGAGAGASGSPASGGGGASSAGAPSAGAPAGGAPSAGAGGSVAAGAGGTGGSSGGAGGASGGASAGTGGGSAGGGNTFAAVKTLIGMNCGVGSCHNKASTHLDFQGTTDLHGLLTTAIADAIPHCKGSILAVANDTNSLLLRITDNANTSTMCSEGGQMKAIARMPDDCKTNSANPRMCLTAAQRTVISDWIKAGVPN
ncbi:MAG: hypothetical protein ABUL62_07305 [Myxococcales bacterium]